MTEEAMAQDGAHERWLRFLHETRRRFEATAEDFDESGARWVEHFLLASLVRTEEWNAGN
jgi:hypothetical protein